MIERRAILAGDEGGLMRGDGRIFRRGSIWWIAYFGPGPDGRIREFRESSNSSVEREAAKLLRQRTREVGNHRAGIRKFHGPAAERIVIAELLDALMAKYENDQIKSLQQTKGHAKPIRKAFGFRCALALTANHVRSYIAERRADGVATATINRELAVLKRAFRLAVQEERLAGRPYIPMAGPENNVRRGFLEPTEVEQIIAHLDPVMADATRLAFRTGWRASEIRLLMWGSVDRAAREVRLETTKNGRPRLLPLDDSLAALFERLWLARQYTKRGGTVALSEYVFHEDGEPLSGSVFAKRWAKARNAAGLPGRLFHDLRRSAIRNLIRAGVSETVAMSISGHVTRSVFDRYNITSTSDALSALQRSEEYVSGQPASNLTRFPRNTDNSRTSGE